MRILLFADTDQCDEIGSLFLGLAARQRDAGHETILVGLTRGPAPPAITPLGEAAATQAVPFRLILQRRELDPGILGQAEIMFRRFKPDLYQSHDLKGAILCRLSRWRPPAWQAISLDGAAAPKPGLIQWVERSSFRRADQILVESAAAEGAISAWRLDPARVRRVAAPPGDPAPWLNAAAANATELDPKREATP